MGRAAPDTPGLRRLFGRKRSHRLRPARAEALARRTGDLGFASTAGPIDPLALFRARGLGAAGIVLEIGFGAGEHLIAEAARCAELGFLGIEPFRDGFARAVAEVDRLGLENVLLEDADARDILERLTDAALDRVEILYPDPWPKRRHHKRRIVSPATLKELARVLKDGGELRFASDIAGYTDWTLEHVLANGGFEWPAGRAADWREPWPHWPGTRYEAKALAAGRRPAYLRFVRRARQEKG
ncbi:MAG: tRNA (guanosine(46)-N7)-methyltransferase TrmB [Alphaproteobacteria bacterium]|nr:tRNA (guanosine(46)-N7)-methyltransferase TrmB [Alphaproteobacteria bacterium]